VAGQANFSSIRGHRIETRAAILVLGPLAFSWGVL
jgi:hypothetical protein